MKTEHPYTSERFDQLRERIRQVTEGVLGKKRLEYSPEDDRLEDFHVTAAITGLPPSMVALVLFAKHVQAVAKIVNTPPEKRPPLVATLPGGLEGPLQRAADLHNYVDFIFACLDEEAEAPYRWINPLPLLRERWREVQERAASASPELAEALEDLGHLLDGFVLRPDVSTDVAPVDLQEHP